MRCNTCQGSGRSKEFGLQNGHLWASACNYCLGRGYKGDERKIGTEFASLEVAKVMAYDHLMGIVQVVLEKTLQQGDLLLVVQHGILIKFEVGAILVANMDLKMALRGWVVTLFVPQALPVGTWLLRAED